MKAKALITVSSFLFFIFSCKKENIGFDYGATYYKSSIQQFGIPRYFTSNGEITNSTVIRNYFDADTLRFRFLFENAMHQGYYDTLIISSPNEVINNTYNQRLRYAAAKDGQRLVCTLDSILNYSGPDEYTKSPTYYLLHYKPKVYSEWLYSSVRGDYIFGYHGEGKTVLEADESRIIFPLILYQQRRNGQYPRSSYLNNYIAKDFVKSIMPGDTLTILEARVYYDKK